MEITFYYAPMSSAVPVASALAELEVPHRLVTLDLKNRDQKEPGYLQINPNGKVPTIAVDGTPMFEALAILQWLGDRFGVDRGLWPAADSAERLTAMAWSTWAYVTWGPVVHQLYLATQPTAPAELRSTPWAEHARDEAQSLLVILDEHLAKTGFVAGDRYSLADLIVSGMVLWSQFVGVATSDYPNVETWLTTCKGRPAIAKEFGVEAA